MSLACLSSCVPSSRCLPADSAVRWFWKKRTSPFLTSCTFLVASDRVGPRLFAIDRLLWILSLHLWHCAMTGATMITVKHGNVEVSNHHCGRVVAGGALYVRLPFSSPFRFQREARDDVLGFVTKWAEPGRSRKVSVARSLVSR